MTLLSAFIARAADTRLRDALDQTRTKLRRTEDENIRLVRENVTLRRKLDEITKSHDEAITRWIEAVADRDDYRDLLKVTAAAANRYANALDALGLEVPSADL